MNICVLCVGRLKEKWAREGCAEYLKRLTRYGNVQICQVDDVPEPAKPSPALNAKVLEQEAQQLLRHMRQNDRVVALCVDAPQQDSEQLAASIATWSMDGRRIVLVIGGSLGLSPQILSRADHKLSFSKMTFPHQLMRIVLLEQLYRAAKINANERYHK